MTVSQGVLCSLDPFLLALLVIDGFVVVIVATLGGIVVPGIVEPGIVVLGKVAIDTISA